MIALARADRGACVTSPSSLAFETMLPAIRRIAAYAFRNFPNSSREELVAEVVANAYVAFVRLLQRRMAALVYPTALAKFAVRQVRDRRRVGGRRSVRDVMSEYAQAKSRFVVESLHRKNAQDQWQEQLIADRRATPAELAACKLDFCEWLARLSHPKRKVAQRLAMGDTTSEAASHFGVTRARISQLRRELLINWDAFQALPMPEC
jgi:hypothetical protein